MEDMEKKNDSPSSDEVKKPKQESLFEAARRKEAEARREAIAEEARAAEKIADEEAKARRSYEEKLKKERLELMKLKQGMISEDDIEKPKETVREYTIFEKIGNFFYHNKFGVIVGGLCAALIIFLVHDIVTTVRPDIQVIFMAEDFEMTYVADQLDPLWSVYGEDYNKDGKNLVKLYYIPANYHETDNATMMLAQSDRTKLFGEFQSGESIIVIGDKECYQAMGLLDGAFADMREIFPDDPYAEELGYRMAGTDIKALCGRPDMDDSQLYVSFRIPRKTMGMSEEKMQENYDHAMTFWKSFLADHRIDGLELEPTFDPEPLPEEDYGYEEDQADVQ